jgi:hypothetical protein
LRSEPESDAFDDDFDHWGIVEDQADDKQRRYPMCFPCAFWFATRLLFLLMVVLFIVWTGALTYG